MGHERPAFAARCRTLYGRMMHVRTFSVAVAVALVLAFASSAAAQGVPGTDDPDYKEILAYRLTLPTVQKMGQATRNMAEAIKNDPRFKRQQALEAEIEKLDAKSDLTEADQARLDKLEQELEELENSSALGADSKDTLSDMAAAIKKEPAIAKALTDAGVDAREYATFMLAYFQAAMVHGMMKSGMVKDIPKELAAAVNMENVKFVAQHEKEFEAFAKEMEALRPRK